MSSTTHRLGLLLMLAGCTVPEFEFESTTYEGPDSSDQPSVPLRCGSASVCVSTAEVTADDNNDGKLNPGEAATIEVSIWSDLEDGLEDVAARLSAVPAGITVTSCQNASYQSCPGSCQCSTNVQNWLNPRTNTRVLSFSVRAATSVPSGPVAFGVALRSSDMRTWQDTFELDVVASGARVGVGTVRIVADDNQDGKLSPGEAVEIEVVPKNFGTAQANDVFAVLTAVPAGVAIQSCDGATYAPCPGQCQCTATSGITRLASLEEADRPALRATLQLSASAALSPIEFGIRFQDSAKNIWDDAFQLDVVPTAAKISVQNVATYDENGDGMLSEGETGSVDVFAENTGSSSAEFYAKLTKVPTGITVMNCSSSSYTTCPGQCACTSQTGMIELAPGTTAQRSSLSFGMTAAGAWPERLEFGVSFEDKAGNKWPDTFSFRTR